MANKTVYPFGTEGTLPGAIRIINDFTTGGADKAASAETVKILQGEIDGGISTSETQVDLSEYTRYVGNIGQSGNWSSDPSNTSEFVFVPIPGGSKKVKVTMDGSNGIIALLTNTDHTDGTTPSYATGETGRRVISNGTSEEITLPSNASVLYVLLRTTTTEVSQNYEISFVIETYYGGLVHRDEIVDDLDSDDDTAPLSARQGKILNEKIAPRRLSGKKVSVVGDSISCFGSETQVRNGQYITPFFKVLDGDVGETIQSWVTWLDVYTSVDSTTRTNKSIGGVTLTPEMIGTKQTFTPVAADVGKCIGVPRWSTSYTDKPWWQVFIEQTGAVFCANASWSGSRVVPYPVGASRHDAFVMSELYSDYTVGRLKGRDDEGNDILPDIIIIYRGINDFTAVDSGVAEGLDTPDMKTFSAITDEHNFTQGYIYAINKIRAAYPNAVIVLCTLNVAKKVNYSHYPSNNGTYTQPDYNNKIREIADLMGCGVIEFDKDGINWNNCYPTYISDNATEPLHPNTTGHQVMGLKAANDVNYYLP